MNAAVVFRSSAAVVFRLNLCDFVRDWIRAESKAGASVVELNRGSVLDSICRLGELIER